MRKSPAFTLIELVIVIAIIGILASLAFPKFIDLSLESRVAQAKSGLGTIRSILATKYAASATGGAAASYPTSLVATDFADNVLPKNTLCGNACFSSCIFTLDATYNGPSMGQCQYWYVTDPTAGFPPGKDYGKAGSFNSWDYPDTTDW